MKGFPYPPQPASPQLRDAQTDHSLQLGGHRMDLTPWDHSPLSLIPLGMAQEDLPKYQQSEIHERTQWAQDMEAEDCFSNFHV